MNRRIPTTVFNDAWLKRIIAGIRRATLFKHKKRATPLTPDLLRLATAPYASFTQVNNVNIDAAFKLAFSGFLRSGEFMANNKLNKHTSENTKLTRSNITFGPNNKHILLRLKRSKTDLLHKGVKIVIAATGENICPVKALRRLWALDPQPPSAPLFRLARSSFKYSVVILMLQHRLAQANVPNHKTYQGHSFRREAA
jgi:hypothetical protein